MKWTLAHQSTVIEPVTVEHYRSLVGGMAPRVSWGANVVRCCDISLEKGREATETLGRRVPVPRTLMVFVDVFATSTSTCGPIAMYPLAGEEAT